MGDARRLALQVIALRVSARDALNTAYGEPDHLRAYAIEDVATRGLLIAAQLRALDRKAIHGGALSQIEDELLDARRGTPGAW